MHRKRNMFNLSRSVGKKSARVALGLSASEFESIFEREKALADRSRRSFAMVVFFPREDHDGALAELATILEERLRVSDCFGSLEDGLLAVLMPETNGHGARTVTNDVIAQLAKAGLKFDFKVYLYPSMVGDSERREGDDREDGPGAGRVIPSGRRGFRRTGDGAARSHQGLSNGTGTSNGRGMSARGNDGTLSMGRPPTVQMDSLSRKPLVDENPDIEEGRDLSDVRASLGNLCAEDLSPLCREPLSFRRRALDIAVAGSLLILLAPLLAALALTVKLTSRGPVLFIQRRAGQGGIPFDFFKFRSMYVDAEARKAALAESNEQDGPIFKMKNDPRMTPIGRLLRRYSLDELPQLYNVLRGEMTLVGPRPPTLAEVEEYEPWQLGRLRLKGGLTCIWQVSGRSEIGFKEWVRMDLRYAQRRSLLMDLGLLARTASAVVTGRGAY